MNMVSHQTRQDRNRKRRSVEFMELSIKQRRIDRPSMDGWIAKHCN
jgi:hypothetical protein